MGQHNGTIETRLVGRLFEAQRGLCFCCDRPMVRAKFPIASRTLGWSREHVYPRARLSAPLHNNVVLSHPACNAARGSRPPTEAELAKARAIYAALGLIAFTEEVNRSGHHERRPVPKVKWAWPLAAGDVVARAASGEVVAVFRCPGVARRRSARHAPA